MNEELTIGIGTNGRVRLLRRCINSIRKYTKIPIKIIVVDNTKAFSDKYTAPKIPNVKYIEIRDKKIGCTETNNIILDNCDTKYLMYMDDDVYIREEGTVEALFKILKEREREYPRVAVGGSWYDTYYRGFRHGTMKYLFGCGNRRDYVKKYPINYKFIKSLGIELIETDELLHSFIINKETLAEDNIRWDDNFKWKGDRLDFFMQLRQKNWKCLQYLDKYLIHDPQPLKYGSLSYEFDGHEAIMYFINKWNMSPLVGWDKYQDKPR